jgi:hypothetical protein
MQRWVGAGENTECRDSFPKGEYWSVRAKWGERRKTTTEDVYRAEGGILSRALRCMALEMFCSC